MPREGAGIRFGQYVLLRRIARGGMAEVFLAQQRGLEGFDRRVAVKRILPHLADAPDFIKMFLGEAKLAAQLTHPNIVHIYEFGKVDADYFIAMEYIEGVHAGDVFRRVADGDRLSAAMVARIGADAAAALHYAHELRGPTGKRVGLVHRDVSPANVMVSFDGVVKLCDFGIAKAAAISDQLTNPGTVKGKYAYMSPEQTTGSPLDGRSDVFALSIILWELLAGRTIVPRGDAVEAMRMIRDGKLMPIARAAPDTPAALASAITWGLQTKRENRPAAMELAHELESFLKSSPELATSMQLGTWLRARFPREPSDGEALGPGTEAAPGTHAGPPSSLTAGDGIAPIHASDTTGETVALPAPQRPPGYDLSGAHPFGSPPGPPRSTVIVSPQHPGASQGSPPGTSGYGAAPPRGKRASQSPYGEDPPYGEPPPPRGDYASKLPYADSPSRADQPYGAPAAPPPHVATLPYDPPPSRGQQGSPPYGEPSRGQQGSQPYGEPSRGQQGSQPHGEPSRGQQASQPYGEPPRGQQGSPPYGEPSRGQQGSQPYGDPSRGQQGSQPHGEPSRGQQASQPYGEPPRGQQGSPPYGESRGQQGSPPYGEPAAPPPHVATLPYDAPQSRGQQGSQPPYDAAPFAPSREHGSQPPYDAPSTRGQHGSQPPYDAAPFAPSREHGSQPPYDAAPFAPSREHGSQPPYDVPSTRGQHGSQPPYDVPQSRGHHGAQPPYDAAPFAPSREHGSQPPYDAAPFAPSRGGHPAGAEGPTIIAPLREHGSQPPYDAAPFAPSRGGHLAGAEGPTMIAPLASVQGPTMIAGPHGPPAMPQAPASPHANAPTMIAAKQPGQPQASPHANAATVIALPNALGGPRGARAPSISGPSGAQSTLYVDPATMAARARAGVAAVSGIPGRGTLWMQPRPARVMLAIGALLALALVSFMIALAARGKPTTPPADAALVAPPAQDASVDAALPLDAEPADARTPTIPTDAAPTTGSLQIRTRPDGATIKIAGQPQGIAPTELALTPGRYFIDAELEGWMPERRAVDLVPGGRVVQEIVFGMQLTHGRTQTGRLIVRTTPPSEVLLGTRRLADSPFDIAFDPGTYTLQLKHPRHATVVRRVTIAAGKTTKLIMTLP